MSPPNRNALTVMFGHSTQRLGIEPKLTEMITADESPGWDLYTNQGGCQTLYSFLLQRGTSFLKSQT